MASSVTAVRRRRRTDSQEEKNLLWGTVHVARLRSLVPEPPAS
jgi:hypothetical protein